MTRPILFALLLVAPPPLAAAQDDQPRGDLVNGKQLFDTLGCAACHGYEGQGSRDGPRLNPPPSYPVTHLQLRQPRDLMPAYRAALVPDQGVADLHAYMMSFPKPPDPATIRLLQEN